MLVRIEQIFVRDDLVNMDAFEPPVMRGRHRTQFVFRFGKRNIKNVFTAPRALQQELKSQCGFAGARRPFYEIESVRGKAAAQHGVQAINARRDHGRGFAYFRIHIEARSRVLNNVQRRKAHSPRDALSSQSMHMQLRCFSFHHQILTGFEKTYIVIQQCGRS